MTRSNIFDEYARIALKQGLISNAEYADKEETTLIESLYGVKPNETDSKHIMEQAHPESVVIAPSYDKLNGLVENELERHNIIVNIIGRPSTGISNHKKYAENELIHELVRIANDLDNRGLDDLRLLADDCIERLSIKKEAFLPALMPLLPYLATAIAFAGVVIYNNFALPSDQGIYVDVNKAEEEMRKLFDKDISTGLKSALREFIAGALDPLKEATKLYWNMEPIPYRYNSVEDFEKANQDPAIQEDIHTRTKIIKDYQQAVLNTAPLLPRVIADIEQAHDRHFDQDGDTWATMKRLYEKVVHTDYREAADHLRTLAESLEAAKKDFIKADSIAKKAGEKIQAEVKVKTDKPGKPSLNTIEESGQANTQTVPSFSYSDN